MAYLWEKEGEGARALTEMKNKIIRNGYFWLEYILLLGVAQFKNCRDTENVTMTFWTKS